MDETIKKITGLISQAKEKALAEIGETMDAAASKSVQWPVSCTVGPGLEGAIACETEIGYVNGSKGWLIYRGYDIFDLCAYSTFEEVSYLLLHGKLPAKTQLEAFDRKLKQYRHFPNTKRLLMSFPVEKMNPMAALRFGTSLMRLEFTDVDKEGYTADSSRVISADEDSIPMETKPMGESHAIYEFLKIEGEDEKTPDKYRPAVGFESCYHLIAGVASLAAAIARLRGGHLPIEPDAELSHAANLLYMIRGKRPSALEERIMDIALILHADHGMNASTFAAMVVASTLTDLYLSVGSGIAALSGPLHGGANEEVLHMLREIGCEENVKPWFKKIRAEKRKISGFGHRVYKTYDPRARILGPIAEFLSEKNTEDLKLFRIAKALEAEVVAALGEEKKIFPNVDFYSGLVYSALGLPPELFTPMFAVSRVSGWAARVQEYLKHNRIFRPRAMYTGSYHTEYIPIDKR